MGTRPNWFNMVNHVIVKINNFKVKITNGSVIWSGSNDN